MARFLTYSLIAVISFSGFLLVLAPAAPLWRLISQQVAQKVPDLNVLLVAGTVWEGEASMQTRQFPVSTLSWQVAPTALLSMKLEANLKLEGEAHHFSGAVLATQKSLEILALSGVLNSAYINAVSQRQGLTFSGDISLTNLNIQSDLKWIQSASGHIDWPGGKIISRTQQAGTRVFDLPELRGDLSVYEGNLQLMIHHLGDSVIDIQLKPDGWVRVKVKARLFDLAALPWPSGSSLDDTVLEFEEKII